MTAKKFRLLILLNWLLLAAFTLALALSRVLLPPELEAYVDAGRHSPLTASGIILYVIAVIGLVLWVVISIGLFLFRRWLGHFTLWCSRLSLY